MVEVYHPPLFDIHHRETIVLRRLTSQFHAKEGHQSSDVLYGNTTDGQQAINSFSLGVVAEWTR